MQEKSLKAWRHSHSFGQDEKRPGESKTFLVIAITSFMMIVEICGGFVFGSMALLADGLHMASHTVALSINAFAYVYARRHAQNQRYSFGTGKVNTLGGYTGAILLAVFAAMMTVESVQRLLYPIDIAFNQAIYVAILGLLVNGASVFILDADHHHDHDHDHDHNLKSAYLHVLADALTSLLAIFALLIGKYFGAIWMDPLMGIVGAVLVMKWSIGLLRTTSAVLLDEQTLPIRCEEIRKAVESNDEHRVVDLHIWSIGAGAYAGIVSVVSINPKPPKHYKVLIEKIIKLEHLRIEVHRFEKT